jgi:Arc/MetJ-type ribon-helix-helix transcriptional regulator
MRTHGHKGWKGRGGWQQADIPSAEDAAGWFAGRLPDDWYVSAPEITVDREEILIVGELPPLTAEFDDDAAKAAAESGRISRFREDTREHRIEIARQAEHRYQRKVAWGARVGGTRELFTTLSVPVMTRLRQQERRVLDTLVDSGVARSRSEALAWAVRLVGQHAESWLGELRDAMSKVDDLRAQGPDLD